MVGSVNGPVPGRATRRNASWNVFFFQSFTDSFLLRGDGVITLLRFRPGNSSITWWQRNVAGYAFRLGTLRICLDSF